MKKFSLVVCILLAITAIFSMTACDEIENGVTIRYATLSIDYVDADGEAHTGEEVILKLYTNYAPLSIDAVIKNAENGTYNNSVINHVSSSWLSVGTHKLEGDALNALGAASVEGEFYSNGWQGNPLTVTAGSVVMYRAASNKSAANYDTATSGLAICLTSSAPFNASEYCVIGKVEKGLEILTDIATLATKEVNDETVHNYYYVGGVEKIVLKADGTLDTDKLERYNLDDEEVAKILEGGEYAAYNKAGFVADETDEDYVAFKAIASKIISAHNEKEVTYFYTCPVNTVTVKSVTISKKID